MNRKVNKIRHNKSLKTRRLRFKKGGVNNPMVHNINNNNGFSATLVKNSVTQSNKIVKSVDLCKNIIKTGKNTTKKNFIPSQLPKLTGLSQKYAVKKSVVTNEEDEKKLTQEEIIKQEIREKAKKDVAAVKDAEEKQRLYNESVLEAEKEYNKQMNKNIKK